MDLLAVRGKRAIVTGAASGIGRRSAALLEELGATVVGLDVAADGPWVRCDVSREADVRPAIGEAVATMGGLDILVCAAGIGGPGAITDVSVEEWDRVMRVNLSGVFLPAKHAIPHLAQGGGALVTVSSQLGLTGAPLNASYCASKAAVINLTKAMAVDHAGQGIRANVVCPGPVDTPMFRDFIAKRPDPASDLSRVESQLLTAGIGSTRDIAIAVAYLASDASAFVTGSVLVVDGGYMASAG